MYYEEIDVIWANQLHLGDELYLDDHLTTTKWDDISREFKLNERQFKKYIEYLVPGEVIKNKHINLLWYLGTNEDITLYDRHLIINYDLSIPYIILLMFKNKMCMDLICRYVKLPMFIISRYMMQLNLELITQYQDLDIMTIKKILNTDRLVNDKVICYNITVYQDVPQCILGRLILEKHIPFEVYLKWRDIPIDEVFLFIVSNRNYFAKLLFSDKFRLCMEIYKRYGEGGVSVVNLFPELLLSYRKYK